MANVLSVASGAARELRELNTHTLARGRFTLLDSDARALEYARSVFASYPSAPAVHTLVGDAVQGGQSLGPLADHAPFDLIYSFGLFDYLPDAVLLRCGRRFTRWLKEDGTFLFCLKDARRYDDWFYDWFYDWRFVPRTAEDGPRLAARLGLHVTDTLVIEGHAICIYICRPSQSGRIGDRGARQTEPNATVVPLTPSSSVSLGDTDNRGDAPNEMSDNPPAVELGRLRNARASPVSSPPDGGPGKGR